MWLHNEPSDRAKHREAVKKKIQDIYDDSKQNYGASKIAVELRKLVKLFWKELLVHICARWESVFSRASHGRSPQKILIFSTKLQNILDEQFNPDRPNAV